MSPLLVSGVSAGLLLLSVILYSIEDTQDRLLVLGKVRSRLSVILATCFQFVQTFFKVHVWNRFQVIAHYVIHSVLHILWMTIRYADMLLKSLIRRNRERVATIRARQDKNHLDEIADHKEESRLSDEERSRRLSHD